MSRKKLSGPEAEEWFKQFAEKCGILIQPDYKIEELVRTLDKYLQIRLSNAMTYVLKFYPDAHDWVGDILHRRITEIGEKDREGFSRYLLDRAAATDFLIEMRNNQGQTVRIAVDVTVKQSQEEVKLTRIRGMPDENDAPGSNRNLNFSSARKQLKIDKHFILVLEGYEDKLPSYERLLSDISAFANGRSSTKSLNLTSLQEHECFVPDPITLLGPEALWKKCSEGISQSSGPEKSTQICVRAIRIGVTKENIFNMLKNDPQFTKLSRSNAEKYLNFIYERANERLSLQRTGKLTQFQVNLRGLKAARTIVSHVGKNQANGDRVAKGGDVVTMTQRGDDFKIERSDERGVILNLKDKRLSGTLSIRDLQTFEELAGQFQAAAQKEAAVQKDGGLES